MFKKLKQKIEEGGEGGIDKVSFSPKKFPGAIVRSPPAEAPDFPALGGEDGEEKEEESSLPSLTEATAETAGNFWLPTQVPSHLKSILNTDTMLAKIDELQQERTVLEQQLREVEKTHQEDRARWKEDTAQKLEERDQQVQEERRRVDKYDSEATELKLQVVELQLERDKVQEELEREVKSLRKQMASMEQETERQRSSLEEQIATLQETLSEKETLLAKGETQLYQLETTTRSLESRIEAYNSSSENDMVQKLQTEMLELERRLKSRMVDIDLLETRLTVQDRQREAEQEAAIEKQEALETSLKELTEQLSKEKSEKREALRALEKEQYSLSQKEEELSQLHSQFESCSKKCKHLEWQLEEVKRQDYIGMIRERDIKISELSQALEYLRTEVSESKGEEMEEEEEEERRKSSHVVKATLSVGVQTVSEESPAAVLPVNTYPDLLAMDSLGGDLPSELNGNPATMQSLGPVEELQALRQEQLRYQEEMAEKNKVIKLQQQKIVDMRKTLNKELRSQSSVDSSNHRSPLSPSRIAIASDVNFHCTKIAGEACDQRDMFGLLSGKLTFREYLKHVVIKFICSRDDEATQLVRAIATLLEFNPQEEKHVKDFLDYKMSWFGSMPPPLFQPTTRT